MFIYIKIYIHRYIFKKFGSLFAPKQSETILLMNVSFSSSLLSSLELSDTNVCEPYTRALLGIASQFCEPQPAI